MSSRQNEEALDGLHTMLTEVWRKRLVEAQNDPDKPLTAAEATSIAKFLADNGIKGISGSPSMKPIQSAVDALEDHQGIADLAKFRTRTK